MTIIANEAEQAENNDCDFRMETILEILKDELEMNEGNGIL